jgi:hypothetical protein
MRILIDECIDQRFRNSLPDHDCQTARYAGLAGLKNGELLTAAETAKFDVFLTVDQGIEYQQNLTGCQVHEIEESAQCCRNLCPRRVSRANHSVVKDSLHSLSRERCGRRKQPLIRVAHQHRDQSGGLRLVVLILGRVKFGHHALMQDSRN